MSSSNSHAPHFAVPYSRAALAHWYGYTRHTYQPSRARARIRLFIGHYVLSTRGDIFATSFINPMRSIYETKLLHDMPNSHYYSIMFIRFDGSHCACARGSSARSTYVPRSQCQWNLYSIVVRSLPPLPTAKINQCNWFCRRRWRRLCSVLENRWFARRNGEAKETDWLANSIDPVFE